MKGTLIIKPIERRSYGYVITSLTPPKHCNCTTINTLMTHNQTRKWKLSMTRTTNATAKITFYKFCLRLGRVVVDLVVPSWGMFKMVEFISWVAAPTLAVQNSETWLSWYCQRSVWSAGCKHCKYDLFLHCNYELAFKILTS